MVNIATLVKEESGSLKNKSYHILYEVAAYDLNVFLTTLSSQLRRKRKESAPPERNNSGDMQSADLILESRNLADALDYLHNRLYYMEKITLSHNDIKAENILVMYPDSTDPTHKYPVRKWKLADFGLSKVKEKRKQDPECLGAQDAQATPIVTEITHRLEPSTSVSNTVPKRVPGRYTAPEFDCEAPVKSDGRKADVWSFDCVLFEVVAYAVQMDPTLVGELREYLAKAPHTDQRFYDVRDKATKQHFHDFLDGLPKRMQCTNTAPEKREWITSCIKLVK